MPLVRESPNGMLLTYEQLAEDAREHTRAMLRHFGLECSEQTQSFTDSLYEIQARGDRAPSKTGWGDMYFNVFRNSRKEKDAWRKKISAEDWRKIEAIVGDSEAVAYGATLGDW